MIFFQAEDGIRDYKVTGVQTCALPISYSRALELTHDTPGAVRAYRAFLQHEAAERARQRPEYGEHAQNLDAFRDQAKQGTAGKAPRGSCRIAPDPPGTRPRRRRRVHVLVAR